MDNYSLDELNDSFFSSIKRMKFAESVEFSQPLTKEEKMTENFNRFAWDFLLKVSENPFEKEKNYFISPLSMGIDWAMLENGAKGETFTQINKALRMDNYSLDEVNDYFFSSIKRMKSAESVEFNLANALFYNTAKNVELNHKFAQLLNDKYSVWTNGGAYGPEMTAQINAWCSKQTKGKIKNIVDKLDREKGLFDLLNAVYLKVNWSKSFEDSYFDYFTTAQFEKEYAEYIHDTRKLKYNENDKFQYAEVPLLGGKYVVFFILPKIGETIPQTIAYFKTYSNLRNNTNNRLVNIYIPKFKIEYELMNVIPVLKSMGIENAFDSTKADLYGCFSSEMKIPDDENPTVNSVVHKTTFEVTKTGVEASAATRVEVWSISLSASPEVEEQPIIMKLDRPFIYGIKETETGMVLFSGCMNNPTKE